MSDLTGPVEAAARAAHHEVYVFAEWDSAPILVKRSFREQVRPIVAAAIAAYEAEHPTTEETP